MSGFFTLLTLIKEILDIARGLQKTYEQVKNEAWFQESAATFKKISEAKTPDEKKRAVAMLAKLYSQL